MVALLCTQVPHSIEAVFLHVLIVLLLTVFLKRELWSLCQQLCICHMFPCGVVSELLLFIFFKCFNKTNPKVASFIFRSIDEI